MLTRSATEPSEKIGFDMFAHGFMRDLDQHGDMCEYACARLRELAPHLQPADWLRLLMQARTSAFISKAQLEVRAEDPQ